MYLKLKNLRKKKKYTVTDMANFLKMSPSYYSQIENGKRKLTYKQAKEIAQIFGKKPDQIFYTEDV